MKRKCVIETQYGGTIFNHSRKKYIRKNNRKTMRKYIEKFSMEELLEIHDYAVRSLESRVKNIIGDKID